MRGWIYLIKNGDLHKIGITRNINNRMRQLKPDKIVAKSNVYNYRELERHLHSRYKKVRIPQTEYFRLNISDIKECKKIIILNSFFNYFFLRIFIRLFFYIFIILTSFILFNCLIYYDWRIVITNALACTEKVSFLLIFISFFNKSGGGLELQNEFRFRMNRVIIYLVITLLLNSGSHILQYYFPE